jgi:uncharacterized protein YhaN
MYRSEVAICKHAQPGIAGQSFSELSAIRDLRFELNRQEEVEAELASQLAEALKLHTTVAQGSAADMLAVAEAVLKEAAESTQKRRTALALRDSQMTEITRLEAKLVEAGESVLNWRQSWEAALHDAGLPSGASPAAVEAYLTSVREIAAGLATANDLRDRIAKMQADAGVFGETVGELVERLNPALRSMEPETAIAQLHQALLEANENRKLLRQEIKRQGEVEPKLRQAEQTASRCAAELDEVYREFDRARRPISPRGLGAIQSKARIGTCAQRVRWQARFGVSRQDN